MKIIVRNRIEVQGCPSNLKRILADRLTIENPAWKNNDRMGRWNGETARYLILYEHGKNGSLTMPRGFARQLIGLCRRHGVPFEISDRRRTLPPVSFSFDGKLKPFQYAAVKDILRHDFGTLNAPTGSGKTVMALSAIAERKQPALVVVHTKELLNQWIDRIGSFLGIPSKEVGRIGGGKRTMGDKITVALVQSLYRCAEEVAPRIGHLIVDECHRTPSRTFTEAVNAFDCRYMLGLSATPWRRDRLSRLIFWHLGDVVHEVNKNALLENGDILKADVTIRETEFRTNLDPSEEYSAMLSELTQDHARNTLIASDVAVEALKGKGVCLVLSDRKGHCRSLKSLLETQFNTSSEVLTGDLGKTDREALVKRLDDGDVKVLVATGALAGEGFDCPSLSTLFLATPIKFSGRVTQYLGRVLRPAPGKSKAKVYDYVDEHVGVLRVAAKARQRVFDGITLTSSPNGNTQQERG